MISHDVNTDANEGARTPQGTRILRRKPLCMLLSIFAGLFVALVVLNLLSAVVELAGLPGWMLRVAAIFGAPIFVFVGAFVSYRHIGQWLGRSRSG